MNIVKKNVWNWCRKKKMKSGREGSGIGVGRR